MTLWIGNGAVHKSSSMTIKRSLKINNSWPELFKFQNSLFAIDWNFQELHNYLSIKS